MPDKLRPKFETLKLLSANIYNSEAHAGGTRWNFNVEKEIEIGVAYPKIEGISVLAILKLKFSVAGHSSEAEEIKANFDAVYEAVFKFDPSVTNEEIDEAMERDDELQFLLSAQAVVLAGVNFRNIIHSCGFDPKLVPLGI